MKRLALGLLALAGCASAPKVENVTDFFLRDQNGTVWSSQELKDQPLLIDFWATWCKPCLDSIPTLNAFHEKHGAKVKLLGIASDNKGWEVVRPLLARHGVRYSVAVAHSNLAKAYGLRGYPYLVLLRGGRVEKQLLGRHSLEDLEKKLADYLR